MKTSPIARSRRLKPFHRGRPVGRRRFAFCPQCQSLLVLQQNRRTRQWFLGCEGYPRCSYTTSNTLIQKRIFAPKS